MIVTAGEKEPVDGMYCKPDEAQREAECAKGHPRGRR